MSKIISLFLMFILGCNPGDLQKVSFIVHTPNVLPDSEAVYICGNIEALGNWNPNKKKLKRIGEKEWSVELKLKTGIDLEYKFTRGSWDTEPTDAGGMTMDNQKLTVRNDTTINFYVVNWKDEKHNFRGQITGNVVYHKNMTGNGILPRDVIVWLPASYAKNPEKRYPVLYMHDGQNIIDPKTSYTGIDWQVDEEVTRLSSEGKMKEIIIVGINNSQTRTRDYSDTPRGRSYMNFITEKLKPFIDKQYRTLPDRENTATMGSSMGGLISFMLVWYHPDVFYSAACLSPAFTDQFDYAIDWVEDESSDRKNIRIYIDCGGVTLDKRLLPGAELMVKTLKKKGFVEGQNLMWYYSPQAEHNEAAWAKRVWRPLTFLFPVTSK